jgi:hypothetical protein
MLIDRRAAKHVSPKQGKRINAMKVSITVMLFISVATVLLAAITFTTLAAEAASDALEIRWVMAGIEKDTDPSHPVSIPQETTLRTGDKIKMYLKAVNKCFFYLFYQNPEGQLRLIYPDSLPSEGLVSGTQLTVPQGDQWFELDEQTGTETFHVLVSPTPLRSIETLYENYRQHASENSYPAARIITAIERLRTQQRPLTSKAERPLSIGGTIRGSSKTGAETTGNRLDHLAEDIATASVFCRTYTIEHH